MQNQQDPASIELELRKGEAYDMLRELRASISHILALNHRCVTEGTNDTTRAAKVISNATEHRDLVASQYIDTCDAILRLDADAAGFFPALLSEHLVAKPINNGTPLNAGSKTDSWIWTVGTCSEEGSTTWEDNSECTILFI